jgi:hypothetical protein
MGLSINHPNTLKVGIPAPFRQIMGMTDSVPINRTFITDFAARHEGNLP